MIATNPNLISQSRIFPESAKILQFLDAREDALKAPELAKLIGVTRQQIYKLAAANTIPSFRVASSVRFDPKQLADWLRCKMPRNPLSTGATAISRAS